MKPIFLFKTVLYLLPILSFISCSGLPQLQSENPKTPIVIDGDKNDWSDKSVFIKDANLSFMVSNDDKYLYIFASIPNGMEFLARGLTIWFDNKGKEKSYFGLHYPLGMSGRTNPGFPNRPNEQLGDEDMQSERRRMLAEQLLQMDRYEIVGEKQKDKKTFYTKDNNSIQVALKEYQSSINYEARIPLHITDGFDYAIKPNQDNPILLDFEFGSFERNRQGRDRQNNPGRFPSEGIEPGQAPVDQGSSPEAQNARRRRGENNFGGSNPRAERPNFSTMENFSIKVILK